MLICGQTLGPQTLLGETYAAVHPEVKLEVKLTRLLFKEISEGGGCVSV